MNKYHQELLEKIKKVASSNPRKDTQFDANKYMGTTHPIYNITNPLTWEIVKSWVKAHQDLSLAELLDLLDSLFKGESSNERSLGGKLLQYYPKLRQQVKPECLDSWLTGAEGWGEVDSLCQGTFTAKDMLGNWIEWEKLLNKFSKDTDVHKRRASLVLLTAPVREVDDKRLADLAFKNIDKLKEEKDILITKAVSWLLRDLIKYHKDRVQDYLDNNTSALPKIATREVRIKLLTGRKTAQKD